MLLHLYWAKPLNSLQALLTILKAVLSCQGFQRCFVKGKRANPIWKSWKIQVAAKEAQSAPPQPAQTYLGEVLCQAPWCLHLPLPCPRRTPPRAPCPFYGLQWRFWCSCLARSLLAAPLPFQAIKQLKGSISFSNTNKRTP